MNVRGMALITGLLLLAAVSLLALAGTSGMILQNHMASNFMQGSTALQNAELAQSEGQAWLFSRPHYEREPGCLIDCLLPVAIHSAGDFPTQPEHESLAWWNLNGVETGVDPVTGLAWGSPRNAGTEAPRWIIEEVHFEPLESAPPFEAIEGVGYYRILGRGTGGHGAGGGAHRVAVTEAIVARPWGADWVPLEYPPTRDPVDYCQQLEGVSHPVLKCGLKAWRQRR